MIDIQLKSGSLASPSVLMPQQIFTWFQSFWYKIVPQKIRYEFNLGILGY